MWFKQIIITIVFLVALTACSAVSPDTAAKYKQENILDIEIHIPAITQSGVPQSYTAHLSQTGIEMDQAEQLYFRFWNDESVAASAYHETIVPTYEGNGTYTATATLPHDGIYYVQVTASSDGSTVMPTKRFTVGDVPLADPAEEVDKRPASHGSHH